MAELLDGKATAKAIRTELKREIKALRERAARPPQSVFIQVGEDPASTLYVDMKHKLAGRMGVESRIERYPAELSQAELLSRIAALNADPGVHGILVQVPLPAQIDEQAVVLALDPRKDVDCFHPENVGRMMIGLPGPRPATPQGVLLLLGAYGVALKGANVTMLGRSNLVGRPLGIMLLHRHATVTYCHTRTRDLAAECRRADVLIAAAGKARLVTGAMVKPGAVVVDVGTNHEPLLDEAGQPVLDDEGQPKQKLVGDVVFDEVEPLASYISPVPGGVGPMTIASVLSNVVTCYKAQEQLD